MPPTCLEGACRPVREVGPQARQGPVGEWGVQARRGVGPANRLVGELGPQARRGVGPASRADPLGSSGSQAREPDRFRGWALGSSGSQAREPDRCRGWAHRSPGSHDGGQEPQKPDKITSTSQARFVGLPGLGARRKLGDCNVHDDWPSDPRGQIIMYIAIPAFSSGSQAWELDETGSRIRGPIVGLLSPLTALWHLAAAALLKKFWGREVLGRGTARRARRLVGELES